MDKKKKARRKKIIGYIAIVLVVALLATLPMLSTGKDDPNAIKATIVSAQAEKRDIDTVLVGGGQLDSNGVYSLKIPKNVKLTEFLVGNGDTVLEGDPIAVVDSVSVMTAIAGVEDTLKELAEEISKADTSTTTSTVSSKPSGRVKAIYGSVGDSVEDIMLQYGCLAVISLDDTMAVKIGAQTTLAPGDRVAVQIDGESVTGRVKTNVSGALTVTVEDNNYSIDQTVTVCTEDGKNLGNGKLYVYNAWHAVAYSGSISTVSIKENQSVYAGQALFSVTESGKSAAYQKAIDKRHKYEALEAELFQMYRSGVIKAPCDGIVSGIDTGGVFMLASTEGENGIVLMLLSDFTPEELIITTGSLPNGTKGKSYSAPLSLSLNKIPGIWSAYGLPGGLTIDPASGVISGTPTEEVSAKPVAVCFTPEDGDPVYAALYLTIERDPNEPQYTGYVAKVIDGSSKGGSVKVNYSENAYTIANLSNLPPVDVNSLALTQEAIYANNIIGRASLNKGDVFWAIFDDAGELCKVVTINGDGSTGEIPVGSGEGGMPGGSGGGGMPGGFSGGGGGGAPSGFGGSAEEDDGLYSLGTVTVATVTSQEQMTVSISVDELDITRIYVGQAAKITMNSIAGDPVSAIVKKIANKGENTGGNSKFTVELALEKSSQMLPGMNATATITLDTAQDALCVPAAAVYELDGKHVVYIGLNIKDNLLSNPVEVTIGVADADFVQILSGLSAGATVYYETYEASTGFPVPL